MTTYIFLTIVVTIIVGYKVWDSSRIEYGIKELDERGEMIKGVIQKVAALLIPVLAFPFLSFIPFKDQLPELIQMVLSNFDSVYESVFIVWNFILLMYNFISGSAEEVAVSMLRKAKARSVNISRSASNSRGLVKYTKTLLDAA